MSYDFVKLRYVSFEDNLLEDFYKPVIRTSNFYKRMAGYFSSTIIDELYDEIKYASLNHEFKVQIICSPEISQKDKESIEKGYEIKNIIEKSILEVVENSIKDSKYITMLSKLIINGTVDFKFALTKNGKGLFHAKEGIFYNDKGEKIGFNGSNNETVAALKYNYETTNIYKENSNKALLNLMEDTFDSLWEDKNTNVLIYNFTEDIFNKFKEVSNFSKQKDDKEKPVKISEKFTLYPYQKEAIDSWEKNTYKGLLEMATGTGKTITALACHEKLYTNNKELVTIIVVPQKDLLSQWDEEVKSLKFNTIKCSSDYNNWDISLKILLRNNNLSESIVITTSQTFISSKMQNILKNYLKGEALLISDEVHSFGANETRKIFKDISSKFKFLLGVSATPFRKSDKETDELLNLFNGIVFSYNLKDAIENDFLNKYHYMPVIVPFNDEELHTYRKEMRHTLNSKSYLTIDVIENITSTIINSSTGKINILKELIFEEGINEPKIIYASPGNFNDSRVSYDEKHIDYVTKQIGSLGCNTRKVNAKVSIQERDEILTQFKAGKLDTLVAVKVLDQGVNLKSVTHAYILSSTDSKTEFIQRRGRILRKDEGKPSSKIYDIVMLPHDIDDNFNKPSIEDAYVVSRELKRMKEYNNAAINQRENEILIEKIFDFYEEVLKEYEQN